jgi:hypothetical protein
MYTLKIFFKSKWLEIAIVAISFQLITTAISIFLGNRPLLIMFTAVGLILLIVLVTSAAEAMKGKSKKEFIGNPLNINRKGIIFTIGLKSHSANSTVMKVIEKMSPQYYGFIGTEQTFAANIGQPIAQSIGLKEGCYREKAVDPTNIREIKEDTTHLIQWMIDKGLSKDDIVVDITGGTAIMSIASYIAADENKIDTQYVYSEYRDNKPVEGSQKALMVSSYESR